MFVVKIEATKCNYESKKTILSVFQKIPKFTTPNSLLHRVGGCNKELTTTL